MNFKFLIYTRLNKLIKLNKLIREKKEAEKIRRLEDGKGPEVGSRRTEVGIKKMI